MEKATLTGALKDAMTLKQAAAYFPRRPHIATIWRWCTNGCHGVKLESWMIGGMRVTTPAAIEEFLQALNADRDPPRESEADRLRRAREAGRALEALGC